MTTLKSMAQQAAENAGLTTDQAAVAAVVASQQPGNH